METSSPANPVAQPSGWRSQRRLALLQAVIPRGQRVAEWGCGDGAFLEGLAPSRGLGIDRSEAVIAQARERGNPQMQWVCGDVLSDAVLEHVTEVDYLLMDRLAEEVEDVQALLERAGAWAHARTRLVLTSRNNVYRAFSGDSGAGPDNRPSNWLSRRDLVNLLELAGWELVEHRCEQLCPIPVPGVSWLLDRWFVRLPLIRHFGQTILLIARPKRSLGPPGRLRCSVVVPMRNEAGNIKPALDRIPALGAGTEIIFVEGGSADDTWDQLQAAIGRYDGPHQLKLLQQSGKGKWDAVRTGFQHATGDILVIQDGDLTAPPEDLPKFFEAVASGAAEFANGSRLVYPMEGQAMRFLNLIGNKVFALALSEVLGQPIKDSLCGTKMLLRSDYERLIEMVSDRMGDFDPFGDFNLLFGASMAHLRIRDIPIRYRDRQYGSTNISRFRHGVLLARMTWLGLRRIYFFPY